MAEQRAWFHSDRATQRAVDIALAAGLFLLALADIALTSGIYSVQAQLGPAVLCATAMCCAVWWRRSRPLLVVIVALAAQTAAPLVGVVPQSWLLPYLCVVAYSVGAHAEGWETYVGLAGSCLTGWVIAATAADGSAPIDYVWTAAMLGVCWTGGAVLQRHQRTAERLRVRALADQRAAIARELHDVVAHSLTVVVMTADAAEMLMDKDPRLAAEPLRTIRQVAQEALGDMRRLVGILRVDDGRRDPQPGLSDLDTLVDHVRASGMPVTLSIQGRVSDLPAGIDLAAYRIIQEALTNARRHAGHCQAWVTVIRDQRSLQLEIINDGKARPSGIGSGSGIVGLRERVALYRGALDAAPLATGGFRVAASLPLAELSR